MNEQDFAELAAGAALNALSPEDDTRFREALAAHPEWRPIADADAETTAMLSVSVAPTAPPAGTRAALLAQIATTPQELEPSTGAESENPDFVSDEGPRVDESSAAAPDASSARAPKRRWMRAVFALAACLAVLVGVGIGAVALNGQLNRPASVIALEEIQSSADAAQATVELDSGGTATAHWSASTGTAVLVTDGVLAIADDETYELWYIRGETAIPAGLFDVDAGRATAALDGDMHVGDVIAVTVEQAGGSPTGMPTTDPIIMIPTA